jgi:hypothetical protein
VGVWGLGLTATFRTQRIVESADLNYWGIIDRVEAINEYRKSGNYISVLYSHPVWDPPQAGTFTVYLQFPPYTSPLPSQYVGYYHLHSSMAMALMYCDTTQNPVACWDYWVCNSQLTEPCEDNDEGYID